MPSSSLLFRSCIMAASNFFSRLGGPRGRLLAWNPENFYPSRWPTDDAAYCIVAVTFVLNDGFFAGKVADPKRVGACSRWFENLPYIYAREIHLESSLFFSQLTELFPRIMKKIKRQVNPFSSSPFIYESRRKAHGLFPPWATKVFF